jgi:hypothetical protein
MATTLAKTLPRLPRGQSRGSEELVRDWCSQLSGPVIAEFAQRIFAGEGNWQEPSLDFRAVTSRPTITFSL